MVKNKIIPTVVLSAICIAVALILSVANIFTAPKIEENQRKKVTEALKEVYPQSESFEEVDISSLGLPTEISAVYATNDGGYVFKASVKGYSTGLVIMCGIDAEGKITGTRYIESKETNGAEKILDGSFNGLTSGSALPEFIKGSTRTSEAYRSAVELSFRSFEILKSAESGGQAE